MSERFPRPEVICQGQQIIIKHVGLTPTTKVKLEDSPIGQVCHGLKNLFSNGDKDGKRVAAFKAKHHIPLENPSLRFGMVYLMQRITDADGEEDYVRIDFLLNMAEKPYTIMRIPTHNLSREAINNLKEGLTLVEGESSNKGLVCKMFLEPDDVASLQETFVQLCAKSLEVHLRTVWEIMTSAGVKPEYF